MSEARLRPSQQAVVAYTGGRMGVSAVPGSGKTFTLSHLAAALVERLADAGLSGDQEVLIVTFTNPAVNSFRNRIAKLVQQERGLFPYVGYRVRTLHGLAHDIVRMRPGLVGLADDFEIVDERTTATLIRELAERWVRDNAERLVTYVDLPLAQEESQLRNLILHHGVDLVQSIAQEIIKLGKDHRWEPAELHAQLDAAPVDLPLARIGVEIYESYQRSLAYQGAVDFDDLVRLAMEALDTDPAFLSRLQERWPYILEDEAQDSSKLQNDMLRLLSAGRNWVRVGDPNQAIYTTFTTADANFLRQFLREQGVVAQPLQESGRSAPAIIALANELMRWATQDPLVAHLHAAFYWQSIRPTEPGDPQPNPSDGLIYIDWEPDKNVTPDAEIERVVRSLEKWLPDHQDWTVAVLVPENNRGFKLAEVLRQRGIPHEELLRSTPATRDAAAKLQIVLDFLAEPTNSRALARLFELWWDVALAPSLHNPIEKEEIDPADQALAFREPIVRTLQKAKAIEDFLWPTGERDWLGEVGDILEPEAISALAGFRTQAQFWLRARSLPIDQLVLTLSQTLFDQQADLALAYRIALVLRGIAQMNPTYRLPQLSQELRSIALNQRRFLGLEDATTGYEPRPGVVTVATMHAAKGLEWDRVYLMAVNNYSFPAALPGDSYISEKWFVRDNLNLQAEAHHQAVLAMQGDPTTYVEGEASQAARVEYATERLRLLYVGITRARRDLIITWNMGRYWEQGRQNGPAQALIALSHAWRQDIKT